MQLTAAPQRKAKWRSLWRGFSLIEVLVSLLILACGLLGMTALQNESLRYSHAAFSESLALLLITDIVERMRANTRADNDAGLADDNIIERYAIDFTDRVATVTDCGSVVCSAGDMADWDLMQWRKRVESTDYLPNGESAIVVDALSNEVTVSIRYAWRQLAAGDSSDGLRTISLSTRID